MARLGPRVPRCIALAALCAALVAIGQAGAQELPGLADRGETAQEVSPTSPEAISARSAEIASELAAAEAATRPPPGDPLLPHLEKLRERLRRIDGLLRQQAELASMAPLTPPARPELPSVGESSAFALNRLYEVQFEIEQSEKRLAEALSASREALAGAREKLAEAERARREARTQVDTADEPGARAKAERLLQLRELESRAAQERVHLRTLQTRAAERKLEAVRPDSEVEARIGDMRDALAEGTPVSGSGLTALTEREAELRRERAAVERRLSTAELRLEAAHNRFSREADPSHELLQEVEALRAKRDAIRDAGALIEAQLERLGTQRAVWQRWDALLRGEGTREELESWSEAVNERIDTLEQGELERQGQRADLERRLETLQRRLTSVPESSRMHSVLEEQRAALALLLDAERSEAVELALDRRLSERFLADLRERTGYVDIWGVGARGIQAAADVWAYEITAVDDAPITVGSLMLALLLAGAGLWASRRAATLVGQLAAERLKLDVGAAHALQTLTFYVLLLSFTLFALRAVHFPLTAFTVLGGALAIGIGFGSQNVMNNFISGLILMLERPVRARDVVEVDGNHGTIEKIGARSTQIRSTDGRHIIVPNSFFLENNVVNWTLSDDLIRTSVVVGVIYGSPTRLVEELIRRVVDEDGQVLSHPVPVILFDEFGDNSLNFEVHFWVRARSPMEKRKVQSRVRFRIDDLFREHDLVIAFPQRDVHLDSSAPIEVRFVNGPGEKKRAT